VNEPSTLSVDEAIALAVEWLKEGRAHDAGAICRRALEVMPGHPDALHYSGMAAYQQGYVDEAIGLVRRSLQSAPDQSDWHSNLGIMLLAQDDFEGAIAAFRKAIDLQPAHAHASNNLGVLLRVLGRYEEAEAAYRAAIAANPCYADAYHNLAVLLELIGRTREAAIAHFKELALRPGDPNAWRHLALVYCLHGDRDKAVELCREWLTRCPDDPQAVHTLAACSGCDVPLRASDAYVEQVFDSFAESFEAKLARLQYHAPDLIASALAATGIAARRDLDVLDLGCGTGLCGPLLAPYAGRLVGVDLSKGMLQHAAAKHLYDELVPVELTAWLRQFHAAWDVIVASDTLVYFGALEPVVAAAATALRPGGVFVFTVEHAVDSASTPTYAIQPHGRYTHSLDYVQRLLAAAGLESAFDRAELRKESGLPVAGLVVRATRRRDPPDNQGRTGESSRPVGTPMRL
jgi:predicted TPR repeat methyltransferase